MNEITLISPDDWHCHLRDHAFLKRTVTDESKRFHRALIMPNLLPPLTNAPQAIAYLKRIKKFIPRRSNFQPLMTLFLTEKLKKKDIIAAKQSGLIIAYKLYPAYTTTHAQAGIKNLLAIYPLLEEMQKIDMPLLVHGETADPAVDIFDREAFFIDRYLKPLQQTFPQLRIVLEHISTKIAVEFIKEAPANIAATITPHHLWINRNQLLVDGLHPHYYCLPILKTPADQSALIKAATSGNPKFFLGTDSAPHAKIKKESACAPAGIYHAYAAIEIYAEIFARENALNKLENFASRFGAKFYRLPLNTKKMTLINKPWRAPKSLSFGKESVIPFLAGETLQWQIR